MPALHYSERDEALTVVLGMEGEWPDGRIHMDLYGQAAAEAIAQAWKESDVRAWADIRPKEEK